MRIIHLNEKNKLTTKDYITLTKKANFNVKVSPSLLRFKKDKSYPVFIYCRANEETKSKGYLKFEEIKVRMKARIY